MPPQWFGLRNYNDDNRPNKDMSIAADCGTSLGPRMPDSVHRDLMTNKWPQTHSLPSLFFVHFERSATSGIYSELEIWYKVRGGIF